MYLLTEFIKRKFCRHLLTLHLLQTCLRFFLQLNTKYFKECWRLVPIDLHSMFFSSYGCQWLQVYNVLQNNKFCVQPKIETQVSLEPLGHFKYTFILLWTITLSIILIHFLFNTTILFLSLSLSDLNDTFSEGNTDTVGQIVHYIMRNEGKLNDRLDDYECDTLMKDTLATGLLDPKVTERKASSEIMTCLYWSVYTNGNLRCGNESVTLILMLHWL